MEVEKAFIQIGSPPASAHSHQFRIPSHINSACVRFIGDNRRDTLNSPWAFPSHPVPRPASGRTRLHVTPRHSLPQRVSQSVPAAPAAVLRPDFAVPNSISLGRIRNEPDCARARALECKLRERRQRTKCEQLNWLRRMIAPWWNC